MFFKIKYKILGILKFKDKLFKAQCKQNKIKILKIIL